MTVRHISSIVSPGVPTMKSALTLRPAASAARTALSDISVVVCLRSFFRTRSLPDSSPNRTCQQPARLNNFISAGSAAFALMLHVHGVRAPRAIIISASVSARSLSIAMSSSKNLISFAPCLLTVSSISVITYSGLCALYVAPNTARSQKAHPYGHPLDVIITANGNRLMDAGVGLCVLSGGMRSLAGSGMRSRGSINDLAGPKTTPPSARIAVPATPSNPSFRSILSAISQTVSSPSPTTPTSNGCLSMVSSGSADMCGPPAIIAGLRPASPRALNNSLTLLMWGVKSERPIASGRHRSASSTILSTLSGTTGLCIFTSCPLFASVAAR